MDDFIDLGQELNKEEIIEMIKDEVWQSYQLKLNAAANEFVNRIIKNNPDITFEEIGKIIRPSCLSRAVFEEYIFASSAFKGMVNKILLDIMFLGYSNEKILEIVIKDNLQGLFDDTFEKIIGKAYLRFNAAEKDYGRQGHRPELEDDEPVKVTITVN